MRIARFARWAWAELVRAWRLGAVRRGMAGTALITVGSLSPAYLPTSSPLWRIFGKSDVAVAISKVGGTVVVMAGILVLVDAWFRLRPRGVGPKDRRAKRGDAAYDHVRHWAILVWWGLPFWLAPPIFSHDAYSYAAQGWLLHNGIDPYYAGPGVLPGAFADQVAWVWRFTPAPYGPLSLQISRLLVELAGLDPYWGAIAQRIPALVGVGLIGLLLPRIATAVGVSASFAAWFAVLNPLLVIDFIGGAHNDSLMMGLVVVGIWVTLQEFTKVPTWVAQHGPWIAGAAIVGVAASIKQPALLAAYALPLLRRPWRDYSRRETTIALARGMASVGIAVGVFALASLATGLNFGWLNAVDVPGKVITVSPATILGQGVQLVLDLFHLDPTRHMAITVFRGLGLGVAVVVIAWLCVTMARERPLAALSYSYLVFALGTPALHSWYMLWGGLLLPLAAPKWRMVRAAVWTTIFLLSYAAVNLSWRNGALALGVAALVGLVLQSRRHDRTVRAVREEAT